MDVRHTRSLSASSEIHITETVSSLPRYVCGNAFRSQRQLAARTFVCITFFLFALYVFDPFGTPKKPILDNKLKTAVVRSVTEDDKSISEYRATYFEEMGKRIAGKELPVKPDVFHSASEQNLQMIKDDTEPEKADSQAELNDIAGKVKQMAVTVSKCRDVPGMSIVLVKGSSAVQIPLGVADISSGRPVTTETKFLLNSLGKTFLGQLLAVLISESNKNITWDTRVVDILGPDFQLATEEMTKEVTLRDLLSHRTGLSSGYLALLAAYPDQRTRADVVKQIKYLPPSGPFRKTFIYSNMASVLAVRAAEIIGGAPYEKLLADKLLTPLGMLSSQPLTSASQLETANFSRFYVPVEGILTQPDSKIYSQGPFSRLSLLSTTALDITRWLQFNLRQGQLPNGQQLILRDVWSSMWNKQADLSPVFLAGIDKSGNQWPVKDSSEGYGLYWFINKYRGVTNYWHGGGLYTHHTLTWHFPEKETAVYIAINGYSGDSKPFAVLESLAYYAADLLLGYQPWLDERSVCTYPAPWLSSHHSNHTKDGEGVKQEKETRQEEDAVADSEKESAVADSRKENVLSGLSNIVEREGEFESNPLKSAVEAESKLSENEDQGEAALDQSNAHIENNVAVISDEVGISDAKHPQSSVKNSNLTEIPKKQQKSAEATAKYPLKSYQGIYHMPLIGNFSVFLNPKSGYLECAMNTITGVMHPLNQNTFGVELTQSFRFLSKPSKHLPAQDYFKVSFQESSVGEITAVDLHSRQNTEVPVRFQKMR